MFIETATKAISRKLRSEGIRGTLRALGAELRRRIVRRDVILHYADLATYGVRGETLAPTVSVRRVGTLDALTDAEREALRGYAGEGYLRVTEERLRAGWELFVATNEGALAGAFWGVTAASGLVSKAVPLLDGDVTFVDAFTLPEQRGRRVYPALCAAMARAYAARGFRRAYVSASELNEASLAGLARAGFRAALRFESWPLGRREIVLWKGRAPSDAGREGA
jgi:hypothetical protein